MLDVVYHNKSEFDNSPLDDCFIFDFHSSCLDVMARFTIDGCIWRGYLVLRERVLAFVNIASCNSITCYYGSFVKSK